MVVVGFSHFVIFSNVTEHSLSQSLWEKGFTTILISSVSLQATSNNQVVRHEGLRICRVLCNRQQRCQSQFWQKKVWFQVCLLFSRDMYLDRL